MPYRPSTHKPHALPAAPQPRLKTAERGYDARWRRARAAFLAAHPYCVECRKQGIARLATVVDHVVPHKGDMVAFWREDNWAASCKPCHDRKTATEDGGFGR